MALQLQLHPAGLRRTNRLGCLDFAFKRTPAGMTVLAGVGLAAPETPEFETDQMQAINYIGLCARQSQVPSGLGLGDMPRALRTATIYPKHNLELNVLDLGDIRPQESYGRLQS